MKTLTLLLMTALFAVTFLSSCSGVRVNGDEEAVLVMKPWFIGHGGVDDTPVGSGLTWCSPTTDDIEFLLTPQTATEEFDNLMTADHTPVDFSAYLKYRIVKGNTPTLYKQFGVKWYSNSLSPKFRAMIRDKASAHKMWELASQRDVLPSIEDSALKALSAYVKELGLPVEVMQVTIGAVTPPKDVLEETQRTAAQNQNKLTQDARAGAELARKDAEVNKAIADNAYRAQMNMTTQEYLQLRQLEIEKEKVELVRDKQNVSIIMGQGISPMYNVK